MPTCPPTVAADEHTPSTATEPRVPLGVSGQTTAPADAAGGRGNIVFVPRDNPQDQWRPNHWSAYEVRRELRAEPYRGHTLYTFEGHSIGSHGPRSYMVRGPLGDLRLRVSYWSFDPTQERFEWLVRNDFPRGWLTPSGHVGNLGNDEIDAGIAAEARADAA